VEETFRRLERHMNPSLARVYRFMGLDTAEWSASGSIVVDARGREYLDCSGGYGVFVHGHRHPKVVEAVRAQLDRMPLSTHMLVSVPAAELAELLARVTPGDLRYSFFCNSGTEAVEGALKLARAATGKSKVIFASGAFHGKSMGALSACGKRSYREPFEPLLPDFVEVPYGDAEALRPDGYLESARRACDQTGALLVLDEVQTGMGRTGRPFACEHYGVVPDVMCLAKALGGGVVPIGAIVGSERVWRIFDDSPLIHTSTFGGNPLACAAGVAAVRAMVDERLPEQAAEKGELVLRGLEEIADVHPDVIAEVRGKGLLVGVEAVSEGAAAMLMSELFSAGILVVYSLNNQKVVRIEPPLNIPEPALERLLDVLSRGAAKTAEVVDEL